MSSDKIYRLRADFNGTFSEVLCLSHSDFAVDAEGNQVRLREGMQVVAFDEDINEAGQPDSLIASGVVERAPEWLACRGSKWVLRYDDRGVRYQSDDLKLET